MSAPHAPAPHEGLEALVELGRGGMGIVRLARRPSGELVVTKELRPELVRDVALRRMFVEEARIASRVRGEHVVRVIETGFSPEGAPYLVMEWARGGSLHALVLGAEALEDDLFLRVAVDLLLGLAEAHEACDAEGAPLGVVHRDVSPHNVLVTTEGFGKILDFGIAKAHDRDEHGGREG
jgi:serine/threonine-protein kinase